MKVHILQSSDSQPRGSDSLSRQQSYSTITAAQLAAALASATGNISNDLHKISLKVMLPGIFNQTKD